MTFNTGNPIGSTDARDRSDNSENLDLAVNSLSQTFVDRLGVARDTLEGIYQKSAYYRAGTFDTGYTLTNNRQTLAYGNIEYSWSGAFPKVVPAGSTPATSGGVGTGAWVDRTQDTIRSDLALPSGSSMSGFVRELVTSKSDTVAKMLSTTALSPWEYADLITSKPTPSDPTTWDWYPALAATMTQAGVTGQSVQLPPIKMRTSETIVVPKGVIVKGCGGGGYIMEVQDPAAWRTVLIKTGADVGGSAVVSLLDGAQLYDTQVSPEFPDLVLYDTANYPAGTNNCSIGVTTGEGCYLQNVTAVSFAYCGFELDFVTKCVSCYAFKSQYGFLAKDQKGDASLVECVGMFCHEGGAWLRGGYWKVLGGRYEWNARHGVILGSSGMVVGATFDRNGWAGVFVPAGLEGNTITGNIFRRNGAGGNGVVGRTSWMTVGDDGYVATADENSCHIRWEGQRRTTISGNYYSSGLDDSNGGADAPKHVYCCGTAGNLIDGLNIVGNHGDRGEADGGYATAYNGGGASVWGGVDSSVIAYYGRRGTYLSNGMRSDFFSGGVPVTGTTVSTINVYVPIRSSGTIIIRCSTFNQAKLAEVYFSCSSVNDTFTTSISNKIGAPVTVAAMANADTNLNYITITLDDAYFVTSTVLCA